MADIVNKIIISDDAVFNIEENKEKINFNTAEFNFDPDQSNCHLFLTTLKQKDRSKEIKIGVDINKKDAILLKRWLESTIPLMDA